MNVAFIDIDGILCDTPGADYASAEPIPRNIGRVNDMHASGDRIVLWTARGSTTGEDHERLTREQLQRWSVKYHELRMGKPYYDRIIDDKSENWS